MAVGSLPSATLAYADEVPRPATASRAWRKFARNPAALLGMLILLAVVGAAVAADWVAPHDPARQSLRRRFTPPVWAPGGSATYPLGPARAGGAFRAGTFPGRRTWLRWGWLASGAGVVVGVR